MTESSQNGGEANYRIGAVARLTGIPTDTLRMWERRYNVVEPQRAEGGNRLYSRDDITRLVMIKRLVDSGHAIGTVANLSVEQLQERMAPLAQEPLPGALGEGEECRVVMLGEVLPARFAETPAEAEFLEIVGVFRDKQQFESEVADLQPDAIVLEYPTLHLENVGEVRRLLRRSGAGRALVVYGFGAREAVQQLETERTASLRAPAGLAEVRRFCLGARAPSRSLAPGEAEFSEFLDLPLPSRRFSSDELARVANVSTSIKCECPHHLADLIMSLCAFESYSAECENRSPDDAALHAYLHATTAQARAMLETALERVVEAEGIEV